MFIGLHVLLAERTSTPELVIAPDEAKQFMGAAQNVMRHYSVETTQKTLDWIAFMGVTAGMYMPRMVAVSVRRKAGAPAPRPRPTGAQGAPAPAPAAQPGPVAIIPDQFGGGFQEAAE